MSSAQGYLNNPAPEGYTLQANNGFVHLLRTPVTMADSIRKSKGLASEHADGWKFHLSIHPDDLHKGWDIVSDIVAAHKIGEAKVAGPELSKEFQNPDNDQAGKQITIYGAGHSRWSDVVREIEIALRKNNVQPGVAVKGDRMVKGSLYTGYRNEKASSALQNQRDPAHFHHSDGFYVSAAEIRNDLIPRGVISPDMAHNPSGYPDSLKDVDFTRDAEVAAAGLPCREFHRGVDVVKAGVRQAIAAQPASAPIVPQQKQSAPALSPEDKALDTLKNGKWDLIVRKGVMRLEMDADMPEKDLETLMVTMRERGLSSRRIDYSADGKPFLYVTGHDVGKLMSYQNGEDITRVKPTAKVPTGAKL